ncbi:MAG TPA: FAD-dependent monooxygenase [Bryobacteraceae bacterium]|jgi:salicylate hydroxylase
MNFGQSSDRICIIGAGIGGLTLQIALRARGIESVIFEQARELTEIGAAVSLSANATRLLIGFGLGSELAAVSTEPSELIFRRWDDARRLWAYPVGNDRAYRKEFGAPHYGVHRQDLQQILLKACDLGCIRFGRRLTGLRTESNHVRLEFSNGATERASLVVGADGIRSVVRKHISGHDDTIFSGTTGFRGLAPRERLPSLPDPEAIQFWVGPGAHLLHYAIGHNAQHINILGVVEGPQRWPNHERWRDDVFGEDILTRFADWHPAALELCRALAQREGWGLFAVGPLRHWSNGPIVLIGDAAHGMLPHQGQGANQTIEDAVTLAGIIANPPAESIVESLMVYEKLRKPRTRRVQKYSWKANRALHLFDGPAARQRDSRLHSLPKAIRWIHGHKAELSIPDRYEFA